MSKALLMILDGWGIGNKTKSDVIYSTATPNWDALLAKYPHSQLQASGENVGLPDGQMGNSEVGHLNIGAGRVVYQDLVKINRSKNMVKKLNAETKGVLKFSIATPAQISQGSKKVGLHGEMGPQNTQTQGFFLVLPHSQWKMYKATE